MTRASSLQEMCHELFASYPLAVRPVNHDGTVWSMVLMLFAGDDDARFFVLTRDHTEGWPLYSLCAWGEADDVDFDAEDAQAIPEDVADVVRHGVPIPRHGSLFGWLHEDQITALVACYARDSPAGQEPHWALMPLAGTPEARWPPFAGRPLLGRWFWAYYRDGLIVSLSNLIAATPETVFWSDSDLLRDWDVCAVSDDVKSPEGYTLPRGCYVYYRILRSGARVPPVDLVLASPGSIDLTPRFRRFERFG